MIRIAVISAGAVSRLIEASAGTVVDEDRKAARCMAEQEISTGGVMTKKPYEAVITAEDNEIFVASDVAAMGWLWNGSALTPPPSDPNEEKARLARHAADKRWQIETGGFIFNDMYVATDDRSKVMMLGARLRADADVGFVTQWKTSTGFVPLDAATIIAISDAMLAHIDACFATEGAVLAAIEAGTTTTIEDIDAANWPG